MRIAALVMMTLCLFSVALAQDDETTLPITDTVGGLTLDSVQELDTLLEAVGLDVRISDVLVSLSPDGSTLAIPTRDHNLCLLTIEPLDVACSELAPDRIDHPPVWSADGRYVATHPDPYRFMNEADILIYDTQDGAWANLTEDGVAELLGDETPLLDTLPMWHPTTNDLYFLRGVPNEDGWELSVMVIRAVDGLLPMDAEPELVADLTPLVSTVPGAVYSWVPTALEGAAAISPDGTKMALLQRRSRPDDLSQILLLDLETGDLSFLADGDAIRAAGMPDWYIADEDGPISSDRLDALAWTADSGGVYVVTINNLRPEDSLGPLPVRVDVANGDVTPLLDYSDVPSVEAFQGFSAQPTPFTAANRQEFAAYVASEDVFLWMILLISSSGTQSGFGAISGSDLEPVMIWSTDDFRFGLQARPFVGEDGDVVRVFMTNYLLTFQRES